MFDEKRSNKKRMAEERENPMMDAMKGAEKRRYYMLCERGG